MTRSNEWIGTKIVFRLLPRSPSHTLLLFELIGLTPRVECYELCSRGWNYFLASLKCYAEAGQGSPYVRSPAATKPFSISHTFNVPHNRVRRAWTEREELELE